LNCVHNLIESYLGCHRSPGAVDDASVSLVESTLLDHLILVLDQELDSLDGGGSSLGNTGGNTGEEEFLNEVQLLGHFWI
jgi:hypothetical protein